MAWLLVCPGVIADVHVLLLRFTLRVWISCVFAPGLVPVPSLKLPPASESVGGSGCNFLSYPTLASHFRRRIGGSTHVCRTRNRRENTQCGKF